MPVTETPPSTSSYVTEPLLISKKAVRARPLLDPPIVKRAIGDSFVKLHPRLMMKNPVMFVVEVGAAMTTLEIVKDLAMGVNIGFTFQITLWLWFTVLFANFAEAMAEGRGKAQADTLRKTKTETMAKRLKNGKKYESVAATDSYFLPFFRRLAMVSVLVLRSVSACALPRPSAMASAKFANSTEIGRASCR